jgi:ArsR family metal-binding transcriptional regulator
MSEKLIHGYELKVVTPECDPNADWFRAHAYLQDDITEALPYLNAKLTNPDYDHSQKILFCASDSKKYAFRPYEIAIVPVNSRGEAQHLAEKMIDTVNGIWERRDEIEPDIRGRKPLPKTLDIFKLLPGTNCKECGYATCLAFANALRKDSSRLPLCPYLSEQDYLKLAE